MVILAGAVESSSSFESLIDYRYDVFLSFRGADTGNSFTSHLYDALVDANLETFFNDDEEIETEEELKPELKSAIKASRASIVVLSKNYATSTWCLDELALILEQSLTSNHIVIPIFYHVEPTDVRKQQSSFGDAIAKHKQKMETETNAAKRSQWAHKIDLWNKALSEVADLKGENANDRLETLLIEDIVKYIYQTLGVHLRHTMGDLIGVDYPFRFISSWLNDGYTGMADVLTISGISGIGKTSLAKYVFEKHRPTFHESSFIQDIGKRCTEKFNGLIDLQKQLHGDISKTSSIHAHDVSMYTSIIENALAGKKVLLILDDIDNVDQLDALLGIKGLHPGSKIIITTKDASLTEKCSLVKPYKHTKVLLKGLNMISSLQLLRFHAFQGIELKDGYKQVSKKLSKLCEGHPLALKVLGRSLCEKDVAEWEEYIERLEKETDSHIKKVLRMSFDSLPSQNDKELFKHIACFFVGMDRDYAETILKACGIRIVLGTKNLLDRSLLTIGPSNELMMYQLLQEMGRDLVLQESFDKPWKRSRLWHHKESFRVLKEKKGKGNLLGLALDMRMFGKERLNGSYVLNTDALSNMYNLMLLQLNYVQMDGSYENFPEELRWLCIHGFPLKSIPSDIPMENLVVLDMSYSNIESFGTCVSNQPPCEGEQKQVIGSLKILDLSFCENLHRLGGFSKLPALERLIVRNCISLIVICESLIQCVELVHIDLRYCSKLENLPAAIDKLEKVKKLLLDGCNTCEPQKLIQRNKALTEVADVKRKYVKSRKTEFIEEIGKGIRPVPESKKAVIKVDVHDDKDKRKAMKAVSSLSDIMLNEMTDNRLFHLPSCSCMLCYNKHQQAPPPPPPHLPPVMQNDPVFYQHDYNRRFSNLSLNSHSSDPHTRWSSEIRRPPWGILATGERRCRPVAGGSPFVVCCKCYELLQIPKKNTKKMRCAVCSEVMLISIINKRIILSAYVETKKDTVKSKDDHRTCRDAKWGGTEFSSEDYDNFGNYDFESMDKLPLGGPSLNSHKSALSFTSEDEVKVNIIIEDDNSVEVAVNSNKPSPPPSGSPFQDHFDYSTKYNRAEKGNVSRRSDMEIAAIPVNLGSHGSSMKDAAVASEIQISSNESCVNTGTSEESGDANRETDQQKGNESFLMSKIKNSFREFSRSSQHDEQVKVNVMVNGHPIPDRLVKKAEKLAGPIQPGDYWYDSRAGFWGIMGGPCRGIIPPFIEEFNFPMPEKCADGNTNVFVNGRELHQKDLDLLASRGLPTDTDRSYVIEISGRVLDEDSGEEIEGLGKLAPTVERKKHGFGMKPPRTAVL